MSNVQENPETDEETGQEKKVVVPDFDPKVLIFACRH